MKRKKERLTRNILWAFASFLFLYSLLQLHIVPERILKSIERLQPLLSGMLPPTLDEPIDVFKATIESLQVAVMGTVWGILLSLCLAVLAAKNLAPHWSISYLIKGFAAFVRAVPALIWALLFIVAVGLGPTPGILALAVNSMGMLVKVYAEAMEEMDEGVLDAMRATGATPLQIALQGMLPSIIPLLVSWSIFRFDINIRYATLLGVVGAGGIGWELVRASRIMAYDQVLGITLVIFVLILGAELISRTLQQRADRAWSKATE